jgi:outer membrane protein OmpA-like peptidoglycan-associated protein
VPDDKDKCPDVAAKTEDGCPPDKDGDGVPDDKDKCPDVPAKTEDGCPPDRDGDGIPDDKDKCPDQPETKNGYMDDDGCPDELPKALKRFTGAIQGINFAIGKADIAKASFPLLNRAAGVLKQFPDTRLAIRGHTDNVGQREANMKLSLDRAQAVKDYLVKQGIAEARIKVEGLGPDEPAADNKTPAGRAKNRRIEFKLLTGN